MKIECECGKVKAELTNFPKETPGRFICYCDDCQSFLHYLNRADLLDKNGGTEIIPIYPADFKIIEGKDLLKCTRLGPRGMFRYSTTCCNTPVANTDAKRPWVGTHRRMFTSKDSQKLDGIFKKVRSGIMGKFGHGTLPPEAANTFDFKAFRSVMPFMLKGMIFGRSRPSAFFDGDVAIGNPYVLTKDEREKAIARSVPSSAVL